VAWELKQTPKVGRKLANWIWLAVVAILVVSCLTLLAWKSMQRDRNDDQKKTGSLTHRDMRLQAATAYFPVVVGVEASSGSTT
jgi:hypothetical protein